MTIKKCGLCGVFIGNIKNHICKSSHSKGKTKENYKPLKKLSEKLKGRIFTKEWKQRLRENHKNVSGINNPMYGKKRPDIIIRNSLRKKERIVKKCKICEKLFEIKKDYSLKCNCQCCSKRCANILRNQNTPMKDTSIEILIQNKLKDNNITFIKHKIIKDIEHKHPCDIFIEPNIVIECDGEYWHNYPYGTNKDKMLNKEMEEKGYKVIRFWGSDIKNNIDDCIQKILNVINEVEKVV